MYGKNFASMYQGSMCGQGFGLFAVWNYAIASADPDGIVTLNPPLMAPVFGESADEIRRIIGVLSGPHPGSTNPEEDGRRIVNEGGLRYRIVSYTRYRSIVRESDRREYERERKREQRTRKRDTDAQCPNLSGTGPGQPGTCSLEGEAEGEGEGEALTTLVDSDSSESTSGIDAAWCEFWAYKERLEPERQRELALRQELADESSGDVVIDFPMMDGEVFEVTESFVARLTAAFPSVDVIEQMNRIRSGLLAGAYKLRDKSLTIAFITGRCDYAASA